MFLLVYIVTCDGQPNPSHFLLLVFADSSQEVKVIPQWLPCYMALKYSVLPPYLHSTCVHSVSAVKHIANKLYIAGMVGLGCPGN